MIRDWNCNLSVIWNGIWFGYVSKMYIRHWKPPVVSERIWSVNFDASISGKYQTLGGHSYWPSELLGSLMTGTEALSEWLWEVWEHLGAPERTFGAPGCVRERQRQACQQMRSLAISQGVPATNLAAPVTSLAAPRTTVEQCGKHIFLWNAAGASGNHSYYLSFNDY